MAFSFEQTNKLVELMDSFEGTDEEKTGVALGMTVAFAQKADPTITKEQFISMLENVWVNLESMAASEANEQKAGD